MLFSFGSFLLVGVYFLCRNTDSELLFSPLLPNSLNIMSYGLKTCSNCQTMLMHYFYMKLLGHSRMFWKVHVFFWGGELFLGKPCKEQVQKAEGLQYSTKKKVLICTYKSTAKQLSLGQRGTNFDSDA